MRRLIPCLGVALMLGCASGTPTMYADGPMLRPPANPSFNPTTDSPNPFERPTTPRIQPQPKPTRVLPETPETRKGPGIWATHVPDMSEPAVFGHVLPIELPNVTDAQREIPRACARLMQRAVEIWGREGHVTDKRLRRCAAAELYRTCINHHTDKTLPFYGIAHKAAVDFYNRACIGMEQSVDLDNVVVGVQMKVSQATQEVSHGR